MGHHGASSPHQHAHRARGSGYITIDRRERFNSLDVETAQDLRRAGLTLARDDGGARGRVCAAATASSAAAPISSTSAPAATPTTSAISVPEAREVPAGYGEVFKQILEYLHSTISEIRRAPKPFIAAVDGIAAAGGFGLAMCCDLVFASERVDVRVGLLEDRSDRRRELDVPAAAAGRLPPAMELVLLNPRLDATRRWSWAWSTRSSRRRHSTRGDGAWRTLAAGPDAALGRQGR